MFNWFKKKTDAESATKDEISTFVVSIVLVCGSHVINRVYVVNVTDEDSARGYAVRDSYEKFPDYQQISLAVVKMNKDMIC